MLHKPKISKLKHLHSIPRYLEHSIPIGSMVALLILSTLCFNPILQVDTYAKEGDVGDSNLTKSEDGLNNKEKEKLESDTSAEIRDTLMEEDGSENRNNDLGEAKTEDLALSELENVEVMPMSAENPDPSAILTVTGDLSQTNDTGPGQTVYRSHGITVDLQDVTSYTLQVSYANDAGDALVYDGKATANSGISGADGAIGANLPANTWGYAWSDSTTAAEANLTYQTMPNYGAGTALKMESAAGDDVLTKNFSGKLVFAAKFSDKAPTGHYKTKVLLSLAATPAGIAPLWSEITEMQEMMHDTCTDAPEKEPKTLTDIRNNATYTVAKLDDGHCWMTQNLRLINKTITKSDSDVTSDFTVPTSISPWNNGVDEAKVHYAGNTTNGAYYTWCAATAGSCSSAKTDGAIAKSSICPKGWRLPTDQEYKDLLAVAGLTVSKSMGSPYKFALAGSISYNRIADSTSVGDYWSSTAGSSSRAYHLYVNSNNSSISTTDDYRSDGNSVRCIAK